MDSETILNSVRKTNAVITVEEAQIAGGFGSAIAELVSEEHPVKIVRIGMKDHFGESGEMEELLTHFGLDAKHIELAAHNIIGESIEIIMPLTLPQIRRNCQSSSRANVSGP